MVFKKNAFTLAELMTVVAVAAILMAIAIPTFIGARNRSNTNTCVTNLEIIRTAIKEWALDHPSDVVEGHQVLVSEINAYVDDGFYSLDCPVDARYVTAGANGTFDTDGSTSDDVVVTLGAGGSVPNPSCNPAHTGHTLD